MALKIDELHYDSIELSDGAIAYNWCHSQRKTMGITVRPDKSVSVRVPPHTSIKMIRQFVTNRAEWIIRVWKKLDSRLTKPVQEFGRGAVFRYRGEEFRLEFTTGSHHSIGIHNGLLIMTAPEQSAESTVREIIDSWYRNQAAKIVAERSVECHRLMHNQGIPLPLITIRSMKTRWGSYSYRTKRISLNLNLVKAPPACLDYVIIHELCHIKVRHHGPDFWRMVSRYVPDYLKVRRDLKHYI